MTPDEQARAEALGVMLEAREQVGLTVQEQSRYVEGFVAGSAWQHSQPAEITEEMVEAAAKALFAIEEPDMNAFRWNREHPTEGLAWRDYWLNAARAALTAALGGEGR